MKWEYENFTKKRERLRKWHPHFTLFPVSNDDHYFWLEKVWRRLKDYCSGPSGDVYYWEYSDMRSPKPSPPQKETEE